MTFLSRADVPVDNNEDISSGWVDIDETLKLLLITCVETGF